MNAQNDLARAEEALKQGDRAWARTLLNRITSDDPDNTRAWFLLSGLTENPDDQMALLKRALAADPWNEEARARIKQLKDERASRLKPATKQESLIQFLNTTASVPLVIINGIIGLVREVSSSFQGLKIMFAVGIFLVYGCYLVIQEAMNPNSSMSLFLRCLIGVFIAVTVYLWLSLAWLVYAHRMGYDRGNDINMGIDELFTPSESDPEPEETPPSGESKPEIKINWKD